MLLYLYTNHFLNFWSISWWWLPQKGISWTHLDLALVEGEDCTCCFIDILYSLCFFSGPAHLDDSVCVLTAIAEDQSWLPYCHSSKKLMIFIQEIVWSLKDWLPGPILQWWLGKEGPSMLAALLEVEFEVENVPWELFWVLLPPSSEWWRWKEILHPSSWTKKVQKPSVESRLGLIYVFRIWGAVNFKLYVFNKQNRLIVQLMSCSLDSSWALGTVTTSILGAAWALGVTVLPLISCVSVSKSLDFSDFLGSYIMGTTQILRNFT